MSSPTADPTTLLKAAVEKLERFSRQSDLATDVSLQKTIDLMSAFFTAKISEKCREQQDQQRLTSQTELLHAIDILKSNYLLIERLKNGTPQQQKLAASALSAIERFNATLDKAKKKPSGLAQRIAQYLAEKNGHLPAENLAKIHLPEQATLEMDYSNKAHSGEMTPKHQSSRHLSPYMAASSQKIGYLTQLMVPMAPLTPHQVPHLSKQTLELFFMKVIALVERHGLLSNMEARNAVRKAHLQVTLDAEHATCTASCALTPFPGQTILVKGSFSKDAHTDTYSLPNTNSFHLNFTSTQTGFPHPLQYAGWSLPDLVPVYPHHLEELPIFQPLYKSKQEVAKALLPNNQLIEKAKTLMQLKREAFEHNKEAFLALHQELMLALTMSHDSEAVVRAFFQRLRPVHRVYDYLAETYHLVHELFVIRPYEALQNAWVECRFQDFNSPDLQKRYRASLQFLENEAMKSAEELRRQRIEASSELEKITIDFISTLGNVFSVPFFNILLQQLSESLAFAPPMLTDFELKLQCLVFKQLKAFLHEMTEDIPEQEQAKAQLEAYLRAEIKLLQADSFEAVEAVDPDTQLPNELEGYFNARFYGLK